MSAPEVSQKYFESWFNIATEAHKAIEKILVKDNPTGGQNCSLETSLGHFTSIQFELTKLLKQGGEVHTVNVQSDSSAEGKETVSTEVDAKVSNEKNVVTEDVSCEMCDYSLANG